MKKSILLVDDETIVAQAQLQTLRSWRFHVELAETSEAVLSWVQKAHFDLVLIDFKLKSEQCHQSDVGLGTGLVRELRARGVTTPILIWTVQEDQLFESASLDAGADDYILKKTAMPTLLSRLHAHMRRTDRDQGKIAPPIRKIEVGKFLLDRESNVLSAYDTPIQLTFKQAKILEVLAANPSRTVPTQELLDKVWGGDLRKSPSVLDSALSRLRQKLRAHQIDDIVENAKGQGFKLGPTAMGQTPST
jgi:DNA-binding response OmpR family regulator